MQGIGQGNGCGPAAWLAVSVPIIETMRTAGYGLNLTTALSYTLIIFMCYAFVDDTDIIHTAKEVTTSGTEVAEEIQKAIDTWEGGLRATGGALVPSKKSLVPY